MNKRRFFVFKRGSKTFFYSSLFFPPRVRDDVFVLYNFVRVADDYVDAVPQRREEFDAFRKDYDGCMKGAACRNEAVRSFVELSRRRRFDPAWAEAFLDAMQQDLAKTKYESWDETLRYVYGSAEVIGLFMASLMGLPSASYPYARMQGRAMQVINFIRDIAEDHALGRTYLPLENSGLKDLSREEAMRNRPAYEALMGKHIRMYRLWQTRAQRGFAYIPRRYLIPVKTASDAYLWTAHMIARDPFCVYDRKVKPRIPRIMGILIKNSLAPRRLPPCMNGDHDDA